MPATASAVEREIRIDATPDTVFDFLVESEKTPIWMGRRAELDPRAGGVMRVEINDQATASGEFMEVDRPTRSSSRGAGSEASSSPRPAPAPSRSR
jgi:uncharacterized protein YndB with AHSA1/START domain